MKKVLISVALLAMVGCQSAGEKASNKTEAEVNETGQKIENRVDNKVDRGIDRALDRVFN